MRRPSTHVPHAELSIVADGHSCTASCTRRVPVRLESGNSTDRMTVQSRVRRAQIVLLGVSVGPGAEDFTLQPLNYRQPSDNVVMTCAAASADGRVFLGGADGHLYELQYSVGGAKKACPYTFSPAPAGVAPSTSCVCRLHVRGEPLS